jgi:hypothetical protein
LLCAQNTPLEVALGLNGHRDCRSVPSSQLLSELTGTLNGLLDPSRYVISFDSSLLATGKRQTNTTDRVAADMKAYCGG